MDATTPPSLAKHLNTPWQRLVEPAPAVHDPEQRRKSRLLAAVLLALLALLPAIDALRASMHLATAAEWYAILATWLLLLGGYLLSRRGYYEAISVVLTISGSLVIFVFAATTNEGLALLVLDYLIIPILFGGLFLSVKGTAAIFLAQVAGIWMLTYLVPRLTFSAVLDGPVTFNLMVGTIALLTMRYRNVLEDSRRSQLQAREAELRKSETAEHEQRLLAEALRDTAAAVVGSLDLDVVMTRILENVGRVVPHDWADISLVEGDTARIGYCRGWSPDEEARIKSVRLPLTISNVQQMLTENAPLLIADTDAYPGWVKITPDIRSFLGTPIRVHSLVIGFLKLSSAQPGFFTAEHAERLRIFADETAVAIEKAQLYNQLQRHAAELEQRITERTAELNRAKRHTEAILNNSSDAILVVRSDGTISQVNLAFTTLLGYQSNEIVNQSWRVFIKPDPAVEQTFSAIFAANQSARFEVEVRRKDGPSFSADAAVGVISQQAEGSAMPDQLVCSLRDISARKRAEEELRRAFEQEKELSELKDRFTAMVSHEYRTPLTVIRMSSGLLEDFPERFSPEKKLKLLRDITAQVNYMVELLDDVLTISKTSAGKIEFNPVRLDIDTFCRDILEQLQLTSGTAHTLQFTNESHSQNACLDEHLLRHILVNLLSNAIKYSPKGGEVRFVVREEAGQITFEVTDQGIGIPAADQARLFEPFHRAKNTGKIQGTGLGLAIVKGNVESHGGTITVKSIEGIGTTFSVCLPIAASC
ncbi:MAG: sensor histidine kinase [Aggregatilineales bacterium]